MESTRSEKRICVPPYISDIFPMLTAFEAVPVSVYMKLWPVLVFEGVELLKETLVSAIHVLPSLVTSVCAFGQRVFSLKLHVACTHISFSVYAFGFGVFRFNVKVYMYLCSVYAHLRCCIRNMGLV